MRAKFGSDPTAGSKILSFKFISRLLFITIKYSRTCLERPPLLPIKSGLSRQVVSHNRYGNHILPMYVYMPMKTAVQDEWSLMTEAAQDRLYCTEISIYHSKHWCIGHSYATYMFHSILRTGFKVSSHVPTIEDS